MAAKVRGVFANPAVVCVAIALYVFALWQFFDHMYLSRLAIRHHHLISITIEAIGAGLVAVAVIRTFGRHAAELAELNRQKDALTHILVHDLRQPLSAVCGCISTAERDAGVPSETRELLSLAQRGSLDLLDMINDLLDVTRMEAGRPTLQRRPVSPGEFIQGGVAPFHGLVADIGVSLTADIPSNLPPVDADSDRLRRVVMNLVGNALKFTPTGGRVAVSARHDSLRKELLVSVSDTGDGIPREQQDRIFDKFAVLDQERLGARTSSGLGLAFAKLVVEAHGGHIGVTSDPGEGATFTFPLPV
jgi:two-component system sensor histidine kinase/response regulator